MTYDDIEVESGPYVVLSDGSLFDDAFGCEIAYMSRNAEIKVLDVQNNGWEPSHGPGVRFDAASLDEIYTITLRDIIRFYFDNHPDEDPMR